MYLAHGHMVKRFKLLYSNYADLERVKFTNSYALRIPKHVPVFGITSYSFNFVEKMCSFIFYVSSYFDFLNSKAFLPK